MRVSHAAGSPRLSVVVPVRNEAGNVAPLVAEIEAALAALTPFEVIYVDDGSSDATATQIATMRGSRPWLRAIRHATSGSQSAAIRSGVRASRSDLIVTIDGDGQNDPAFIPLLAAKLAEAGPACGLIQGQRRGRKDSAFKRLQSRIANAVRSSMLGDGTRDTGCGLKCFSKEVYLSLPYFDALHRFMPALVLREGYRVAYVDVVDRPRLTGASNYGLFDRLWVSIRDLMGVRWLIKRRKPQPITTEMPPP